ncbi:MAG: DUF2851 family protein [Bacteroidota bacterium]
MTEDLLHYIWKFQRYNFNKIIAEYCIEVLSPGFHNFDSGPDFSNAKIRINNILWVGNVEVHLKSSDWYNHKHHKNKTYDTVVLHVVWENDKQIVDKQGNNVPTLELKNKVDHYLLDKYKFFIEKANWIPCEKLLDLVEPFIVFAWLEALSIERLQVKSEFILKKLMLSTNNWEKVFYEVIARNFGFSLNADTFELLAKSLNIKYISRCKNNLFQIEALLFGQAGFLCEEYTEDYPIKLKNEYNYFQHKFDLKPIDRHLWKFLRLRPNNFPTIRIAQFAMLIYNSSGLFRKVIETESITELKDFFSVNSSHYWKTHYVFGTDSSVHEKKLGDSSINLILINTIIPFIFAYGSFKKDEFYKDKALGFLDALRPEKNKIVMNFKKAGIVSNNAQQTQALIQLHSNYCLKKKCLNCSIGDSLLKNANI